MAVIAPRSCCHNKPMAGVSITLLQPTSDNPSIVVRRGMRCPIKYQPRLALRFSPLKRLMQLVQSLPRRVIQRNSSPIFSAIFLARNCLSTGKRKWQLQQTCNGDGCNQRNSKKDLEFGCKSFHGKHSRGFGANSQRRMFGYRVGVVLAWWLMDQCC